MEQGGDDHQPQSQAAQVQSEGAPGSKGEISQLSMQEQAKAAAQEALAAQQEAEEAMKRAYVKQMAAHDKAQQASHQVILEQESAKRVAAQAATEAAEKAAKEVRASKEAHDTEIAMAGAAANNATTPTNQLSNQEQQQQQGQATPSYQSGFVPYSAAVQNYSPQPQEGAQAMNQNVNNGTFSAQRCQEMLMQGANQIAQTATVQMTAAQNLAASAPNPETQQLARKQAETAQSQMTLAHQIAAAAQSPDTAVQAAASLFNNA